MLYFSFLIFSTADKLFYQSPIRVVVVVVGGGGGGILVNASISRDPT